jgi:hypothetical protein
MRPWAAVALLLAIVAPSAPSFTHADALPSDADEDGVMDEIDACLDTEPYALVDDVGCDVCDCDENPVTGDLWDSRTTYLRCVLDEVHGRRADKSLSRRDARYFIKAARNSSCGYETKVRCCIMFPPKGKGMCKIMDELRCEASLIGAEVVENHDRGSCFPNPCVSE